jgi:hypothetical protein
MSTNESTPSFFTPSENPMPSSPVEQLSSAVPDMVGVPRKGRKPFKGNASGKLPGGVPLGGGLDLSGNRSDHRATLQELLSSRLTEDAAQVSMTGDPEPKPDKVEESGSSNPVDPIYIDENEPEEPVMELPEPEMPEPEKPVATPKKRRWWTRTTEGVSDGMQSTLARARVSMQETKSSALSRLQKVKDRATQYRQAVSESQLAHKIADAGTDLAIAIGSSLAKAGMWTVEMLASGWIVVTDGTWKLTLAVANGVVWIGSYTAAAVVEGYESGKELLTSIKAWFSKQDIAHKETEQLEPIMGATAA